MMSPGGGRGGNFKFAFVEEGPVGTMGFFQCTNKTSIYRGVKIFVRPIFTRVLKIDVIWGRPSPLQCLVIASELSGVVRMQMIGVRSTSFMVVRAQVKLEIDMDTNEELRFVIGDTNWVVERSMSAISSFFPCKLMTQLQSKRLNFKQSVYPDPKRLRLTNAPPGTHAANELAKRGVKRSRTFD